MKNKYVFVAIMLSAIFFVSIGFTSLYASYSIPKEEEKFTIVTSFYPMYIATMNIVDGVEGVTLKNLSEPQTGCLHDFQMTPSDMKLLSDADVFVINGGGIESFMETVAKQYDKLAIVEATKGIELLAGEHTHEHEELGSETEAHDAEMHEEELHEEELHEDVNAHAWMSVSLYRKMLSNITEQLAALDIHHKEQYYSNWQKYDKRLQALEEQQQELLALCEDTHTIMFHCAFDYVAFDYGFEVVHCMDLDEERQISAKEVSDVLEAIKEHDVQYIFAEELYGAGMCDTIKKEADVTVVFLDSLTRGEYDKDSYINHMQENMMKIKNAFMRE